MEPKFKTCRHCGTKGILMMADGRCPHCKRSLLEKEEQEVDLQNSPAETKMPGLQSNSGAVVKLSNLIWLSVALLLLGVAFLVAGRVISPKEREGTLMIFQGRGARVTPEQNADFVQKLGDEGYNVPPSTIDDTLEQASETPRRRRMAHILYAMTGVSFVAAVISFFLSGSFRIVKNRMMGAGSPAKQSSRRTIPENTASSATVKKAGTERPKYNKFGERTGMTVREFEDLRARHHDASAFSSEDNRKEDQVGLYNKLEDTQENGMPTPYEVRKAILRLSNPTIEVPFGSAVLNAIRAAGQIGNSRAVSLLITVLLNENAQLEGFSDDEIILAAMALGDIGDPCAVAPLLKVVSSHLKNESVLRRAEENGFGPSAIEYNLDQGDCDGLQNRVWAASFFNNIPSQYYRAWQRRHHCVQCAIACVKALGKIGTGTETSDIIARCLRDEDKNLRESALDALMLIGERSNSWKWLAGASDEVLTTVGIPAIERLIDILSCGTADIRPKAALALGQFYDPVANKALVKVSRDKDPRVRQAAVKALGRTGQELEFAAVLLARRDEDPEVRSVAAAALAEMCGRSPLPAINALTSEDTDTRWAVAKALGRARVADAAESLIKVLDDKCPRVRAVAAKALGQIRDPRAIAPLTNSAADAEESVRRAASKSIRQITDIKTKENG